MCCNVRSWLLMASLSLSQICLLYLLKRTYFSAQSNSLILSCRSLFHESNSLLLFLGVQYATTMNPRHTGGAFCQNLTGFEVFPCKFQRLVRPRLRPPPSLGHCFCYIFVHFENLEQPRPFRGFAPSRLRFRFGGDKTDTSTVRYGPVSLLTGIFGTCRAANRRVSIKNSRSKPLATPPTLFRRISTVYR
jgi:hypothetical protein